MESLGRGLARRIVGTDDQIAVVDASGSGVGALGIIKNVVVVLDFHRTMADSVGIGHDSRRCRRQC